MVVAPSLKFRPPSIDYGTINVGSSSAKISYTIRNSLAGSTCATAKNISISFLPSTNADEAESESWVWYSTAKDADYVRSMDVGPEVAAGSIPNGESIVVKTKVKIPSDAATVGTVLFKAHHRYQYTG